MVSSLWLVARQQRHLVGICVVENKLEKRFTVKKWKELSALKNDGNNIPHNICEEFLRLDVILESTRINHGKCPKLFNYIKTITAQFSTPQSVKHILQANIHSSTSFSSLSETEVSKLNLSSHLLLVRLILFYLISFKTFLVMSQNHFHRLLHELFPPGEVLSHPQETAKTHLLHLYLTL